MAETKLKSISILNKRDRPFRFHETVEYIGRPLPLGNPFKIGSDGGRDEVIEKYRNWLVNRLTGACFSDTDTVAEFDRLCRKYEDERVLRLSCWCAPLRCHGDVIADLIEDRVHGRALW